MDFIGQGDAQKGYTGFAWIIAIAFIVLIGITVCNVKSADGAKTEKKEKTSFKHMLHIIVKNDQLLVAIGVILIFNMAMQIINSVSTFYFIYVTGSKMMFSVFTMFAGFAEIAGLFIYPKMVHKFSRAMVYVAACVTLVVGLVLLWVTGYVLPQNVILTAAAGILVKFGSGLQVGSATVILADVVDYGEYKFGTRNESVTFSIQTLMVKFSSAIGALLTGAALDLTGYVPNAEQSAGTLMGMRIIMVVIPVIFTIISYFIYKKFFKLTGEYYERIKNILTLRRNGVKETPEIN